MQKMTLADMKAMYPPYEPHRLKEGWDGKTIRTHATQKNHRHLVQPVWLPAVPFVTPAQYRRKKVKRPIPVIASPAVNQTDALETKIVRISVASSSGKQNDPAYRKRFGTHPRLPLWKRLHLKEYGFLPA
jgi:hypothetical protein